MGRCECCGRENAGGEEHEQCHDVAELVALGVPKARALDSVRAHAREALNDVKRYLAFLDTVKP